MARSRVTFDDLLAIARRVGVEVVAAPSSHRGKKGSMGSVEGLTLHHTGTPNSTRPDQDYLDYEVVKEGRPGLENSLSAFGLGRWRCIYIFSEYLSWHAGTWSWAGITDGNGHFLGIEAAGVGDWTPWQLRVYPRLVASALLFLGEDMSMAPRHADGARPVGRKTDAANLPAGFADQVGWLMANPDFININNPTPWENEETEDMNSGQDMALAQVRDVLGAQGGLGTKTEQTVTYLVRDMAPRVTDVQLALTNSLPVLLAAATRPGGVDVQQLAAATAALLGPALVAELAQHDGITEDEAEAAAERAVRTVLGSLG